jgi:hypothetical protein
VPEPRWVNSSAGPYPRACSRTGALPRQSSRTGEDLIHQANASGPKDAAELAHNDERGWCDQSSADRLAAASPDQQAAGSSAPATTPDQSEPSRLHRQQGGWA